MEENKYISVLLILCLPGEPGIQCGRYTETI